MSAKKDAKRVEPDVKVHHTSGCPICHRTDQHTHTQDNWRATIDAIGGR